MPNSKIVKSEVVNYTFPESNFRVQTDLGIAYSAHMEKVRHVISTAVRSVDGVMADEPVDVLFQSFGDSSRAVRVRWWIASFHHQQRMLDKVNAALDIDLAQAHIELPYRTYALQVKLDYEHGGSQPRSSAKS